MMFDGRVLAAVAAATVLWALGVAIVGAVKRRKPNA